MKANERFAEITAGFITAIEDGIADPAHWSPPWHTFTALPHNASTGKAYRGGNVVGLWSAQIRNGYPSSTWATYRQWDELGAQVRKGEKATYGVKWVFPDEKAAAKAKAAGRKAAPFPAAFAVFNAAQVDGYVAPELPPAPDPIAHAEAFFAAVGADVRHNDPTGAYYSPARDFINLPELAMFRDSVSYYATSAHEHAHWTGATSRLDRGLNVNHDSTDYAKEELVAELSAAFLCATLGISSEPRPDHAQYLASWLRVLKSDDKALWRAASAAQKAVDFLTELAAQAEPELVAVPSPVTHELVGV